MKRSTFITWDQLKVGAMIAVAIAIMIVAVLKLGESAKLFTRRYTLVTFVPSAGGLSVGGQVTVAGQLAGNVKSIDFLPVDRDTMKNLRITVEVDQALSSQVRRNSKATLRSLAILGDKVFDITPGTPDYPVLRDGDTLTLGSALDYEAVLNQASGALGTVVSLTGSLQKVVNGVTRGDGTIGALVTSRQLYDQLNSTLASTNGLMVRLQSRDGTIGRPRAGCSACLSPRKLDWRLPSTRTCPRFATRNMCCSKLCCATESPSGPTNPLPCSSAARGSRTGSTQVKPLAITKLLCSTSACRGRGRFCNR